MHAAGLYVDGKYKYSGEWLNDKMHGSGKFTYASGSYYDGQWDNSEYQGTGSFCWPDGRHYEVVTSILLLMQISGDAGQHPGATAMGKHMTIIWCTYAKAECTDLRRCSKALLMPPVSMQQCL